MTPSFSYDAFNLPKFASLVFFGIILTCLLIGQTFKNSKKSELMIYGVSIFFVFWTELQNQRFYGRWFGIMVATQTA
jgi:hypothetical protein